MAWPLPAAAVKGAQAAPVELAELTAVLMPEWAVLAARMAGCKIPFDTKWLIRAKPMKCLTNIMNAARRRFHENQPRPPATRHQ